MAGASGKLEPDAVNAMFAVLTGGPILRTTPTEGERKVGIQEITQTLDCNGDLLVAGKPYMLGDKRIMVLREEFGGGNIMDTYQRIFYMDGNFEQHFTIVDASYPRGLFGGASYKSRLKPVEVDAAKLA